jgi:hypothetical protein
MSPTKTTRIRAHAKLNKGDHPMSPPPKRQLQRLSTFPQIPDVSDISVKCDSSAEYVVVISMYEVHNDRIYDLLNPPTKSNAKDHRRRPLLFKSTELSPDRKVVAGLRKIVCTTYKEAIMVLDAGLQERRVAGTGSNSVSSRSHGFFCFEVKKRPSRRASWGSSKLTIVDLAGSERARDAKTQGATLVEAGKINESLMYLGQCLQTQSDAGNSSKVSPLFSFFVELADRLAQYCTLPAVQAHGAALLQLVPIHALQRPPPEGCHDCDGRRTR